MQKLMFFGWGETNYLSLFLLFSELRNDVCADGRFSKGTVGHFVNIPVEFVPKFRWSHFFKRLIVV